MDEKELAKSVRSVQSFNLKVTLAGIAGAVIGFLLFAFIIKPDGWGVLLTLFVGPIIGFVAAQRLMLDYLSR